jgi:hypothetical protein
VGLGFHLCRDPAEFVYIAFAIDTFARRTVGWRVVRRARQAREEAGCGKARTNSAAAAGRTVRAAEIGGTWSTAEPAPAGGTTEDAALLP